MIKWIRSLFFKSKPKEIERDLSEWVSMDRYFRIKGVTLQLYEARTFIYVHLLEVDENRRRQGLGTKALERVIWYANRKRKDVVLEACDFVGTGTPMDVLKQFYGKLGFQSKCLERIPYKHNMVYECQ